jgi:hypothetical protein
MPDLHQAPAAEDTVFLPDVLVDAAGHGAHRAQHAPPARQQSGRREQDRGDRQKEKTTMNEKNIDLARLARRVDNLEAANSLRGLLPTSPDGDTFAEACAEAGLGVRTAQGEGRSDDTARRRRAVALILRKKEGWTIERIARAMSKTERAVKKML